MQFIANASATKDDHKEIFVCAMRLNRRIFAGDDKTTKISRDHRE